MSTSLVRWLNHAEGWTFEVVDAIYLGRDRATWRLRIQDRDVTLSRDEWELCSV